MPRSADRSWRSTLPVLVLLACLAGAAWALVSRRDQLARAFDRLSALSVAGSLVFGALGVAALLASWAAVVRDGGVELPTRDLVRIYGVGQLGKYLPGSVWPVLTQAQLARRRGASPARVTSGSLVALAISVYVALAVGGVLLPFSGGAAARRYWWSPIVALLLLALLHPVVLNRVLALAGRLLRRGTPEFSYSLAGTLRCAAWSAVGNLLFGLHIFLLAEPLGAHGPRGYLLSVCGFALASGVGVLVILAPAGAGVRESVLSLVLSPALDLDAALVVALMSRALLIVVDVTLGLSQAAGLRHWSATHPSETADQGPADQGTTAAGS